MIDFRSLSGGTGHLSVRVSRLCAALGSDHAVLDFWRCMPMGRGVLGNSVARLHRPIFDHLTRLLQRLDILRIVREIGELVGVLADPVELFPGTWIGKDLLLFQYRFPRRMGLPKLRSSRVVIVGFVAEIRLIRKIVPDVEEITETHHSFVILIDVPIMLGEHQVTNPGLRVLKDGNKALSLNTVRPIGIR